MDQDQLAQPIEISRVASRGGSLEVIRWSTGRGRTAVAAHGYLDHGWSWDGLVPHLRSVDLVSFSARGHGNSDRADAYQWTDFVVDLAMVVRSVGAGPIDLIGHSWGAHLALDLAQMTPELVRSVVNIDGMEADHPPSAAPSLIERVRRSADLPFPRSRPGFASLAEVIERHRGEKRAAAQKQAAEMLEKLDLELNDQGVHMAFAEMRERLQDLTLEYGLFETLDRDHFYPTIETAIEATRKKQGTGPEATAP